MSTPAKAPTTPTDTNSDWGVVFNQDTYNYTITVTTWVPEAGQPRAHRHGVLGKVSTALNSEQLLLAIQTQMDEMAPAIHAAIMDRRPDNQQPEGKKDA